MGRGGDWPLGTISIKKNSVCMSQSVLPLVGALTTSAPVAGELLKEQSSLLMLAVSNQMNLGIFNPCRTSFLIATRSGGILFLLGTEAKFL